jgi:hypothetical protein
VAHDVLEAPVSAAVAGQSLGSAVPGKGVGGSRFAVQRAKAARETVS